MAIQIKKSISATISNQHGISGTINNEHSISGSLSLPVSTNIINTDYEQLINLPTINGYEIRGESAEYIMTPSDELSNVEISEILR